MAKAAGKQLPPMAYRYRASCRLYPFPQPTPCCSFDTAVRDRLLTQWKPVSARKASRGAMRAVLVAGKYPSNDREYCLALAAGNYASTGGSLAYRLAPRQGKLLYRLLEPVVRETELSCGRPGIIEPRMAHEVETLDRVRFYVEFHR